MAKVKEEVMVVLKTTTQVMLLHILVLQVISSMTELQWEEEEVPLTSGKCFILHIDYRYFRSWKQVLCDDSSQEVTSFSTEMVD